MNTNPTSAVVFVEPMGKPRMTRADKWKQRDVVMRFRAYKDTLKKVVGDFTLVPLRVDEKFFIAMPKSWSEKTKAKMDGKPHRFKPDRDNLDKGILDSLFEADEGVALGAIEKYWCREGKARVELHFAYDI